jgi:hypothetical protein
MERDRGGAVMRRHICEWCGKAFMSSRRHTRFCGTRCRVASHRFHIGEKPPAWERSEARQLRLMVNGVEI